VTITPRENLRTLLDGGSPQWIPCTLDVGACPGLTDPVQREFLRRTGSADPNEHFDTDFRLFSLPCRFGGDDAAAYHEPVPPGTAFDEWGVGHWGGGAEATVDRHYSPLARAAAARDVEALPSPAIEGDADASPVEQFHARGYAVFGYAGSIYEWCWWLRGMQGFMTDLATGSEVAEALLAKVEAHTTRLALATAEAGADVLCFYDDVGTQRGMQISPAMWRRYVKPAWGRVLDAVRSRYPGARFFLHSCGKIDPIVPDVIELGFHVLHPVQPECMDFPALWRQYGDELVLSASISAQRVFPFASPGEVEAEVRRLAGVVGGTRRAILMPSNRIQPETPWENVVAFTEACRALRA